MATYPTSARLMQLLLLSCCGLVSLGAGRAVAALSFNYNFSVPGDLDRAGLKYLGDSIPSVDRVDITIRDKQNSTGRVFYPQPVRLWNRRRTGTAAASFNTSFSFAIYNDSTTRFRGDGMAFFIGPFPPSLPPADSFGSGLGLFNDSSLDSDAAASLPPTVAVEFDTFWNKRWDPQDHPNADHMGIDVNRLRSRSFTTGLNTADLSGTMSASVMYNGSSKLMVVSLRLANGSVHTIQATVDFIDDARLPQDVAIGFSAATGANTEYHQLLAWSFSSTDPASSRNILLCVIISLLAALLLVGLVAAALLFVILRRQRRRTITIELQVARKFSFQELSAATNNFSEDRKLGAGAFGQVYRGYLGGEDQRKQQQPVAVKRVTTLMEQTRRDYVTEVQTLGRISHRNLVRLVGWCDGGGSDDATKLLLVYELVTNGSLDRHLHGGPDERLLTWAERFEILLGVGKAIEYLHTDCGPNSILHRDIKPSNVMLDDKFVAKLGDFGLVRQAPTQGYLTGTKIIGSEDYIDPVCISNNTVSTASDMYSFGVLLLEMATGNDPAGMRQSSGRPYALVETVQEHYHSGTLLEMADERLNGSYEEWQMQRVLEVGLLCVQHDRQDRPAIKEAIAFLSYQQHTVPAVALSQTTTTHQQLLP